MKDPHREGTASSNYRPIACHFTTWTVLSGVIPAKLQVHMIRYMSTAQKRIGNNTRGSQHQLLIDRAVTNDSRSRQTHLSVGQLGLTTGFSQIIIKSGYGYKCKSGPTISHLPYMDDVKLYAKNEQDIDSVIHLTRIYSEDIAMSFRLENVAGR